MKISSRNYLFSCVAVLAAALILLPRVSYASAAQDKGDRKLQFAISSTKGLPEKGFWKSVPVFEDVNKDGCLDLASTERLGEGARVWLGDCKGNWVDSSEGLKLPSKSCGGGVSFADVNRNGILDMVVADHCLGIFVYLGDGKGKWQEVVGGLAPEVSKTAPSNNDDDADDRKSEKFLGAETLAVADVNGDGFVDIVAGAADSGGFTVYFGDGTGKNWKESRGDDGLPSFQDQEPGDLYQAGWVNHLILRDVNKDGHLDVVAAYYYGPRVWLGDGKGKWKLYSEGLPTPAVGGIFRTVDTGDVNGDGLMDIVTANEVNGVEIYLQTADGTWDGPHDPLPGIRGGVRGVVLADLDGDGHLDVLASGAYEMNYGNNFGMFIARGNGKNGWVEVENTGLPRTGLSLDWGVAVGDVNKNGMLDIAVSTGGIVGELPQWMQRRMPADSHLKTMPELELPRVQVWLNQAGKN